MKEIKLTQDKVTQVDDWWYDFLMQWKWHIHMGYNTQYVVRTTSRKEGKQKLIFMHNVILDIPNNSKIQGEHKDNNGLNNQQFNLRHATGSQNAINWIRKNKTGYRGVTFNEKYNTFYVGIQINGKYKYLGRFDNAIDAAKRYDYITLKYQGEFAITNF